MKKSVLIIDDEKITCEHLRRIFQNNMYEALSAFSGEEGLAILAGRGVSLVVVDLKMPGMDGLTFLREAKLLYPEIPIVVMTAHGTIETAVEAMKCGAGDFITKPFSSDEIAIVAERAIEREDLKSEVGRLRKEVIKEYSFENIISKDKKMLELFDLIKTVAETDSTVFIYGETGTGKELIAKAIHYNSLRRQGRFVSVNCGAISETLLESELFGHEKGAFTGALRRKEGRFELAEGGTLFLDEIGNISEHMQIKLLRVLQEKEFERVGGTETIRTDARIVSA
ncbi:MAG: sigma-54-dependent Fis family transcriptional regulator, partial [Deltaproteobacteria bacterium]|nr:sigma-54-dependent Fis family transcriptional regulator [Deltaproteobacteria bacterium]